MGDEKSDEEEETNASEERAEYVCVGNDRYKFGWDRNALWPLAPQNCGDRNSCAAPCVELNWEHFSSITAYFS